MRRSAAEIFPCFLPRAIHYHHCRRHQRMVTERGDVGIRDTLQLIKTFHFSRIATLSEFIGGLKYH